jgi:membrane dipeptidase
MRALAAMATLSLCASCDRANPRTHSAPSVESNRNSVAVPSPGSPDAATDGATTSAAVAPGRAPSLRPLGVVDFHVDLGWAAHAKSARLSDEKRDASLSRLVRGEVGTLVVPLYVSGAYAMPAAEARHQYDLTFADAAALFARDGNGTILEPFVATSTGSTAKIRVRMSFEGADGFADAPEAAERWVARGVCLFGLVHSRSNALGGSSQDPSRDKRKLGLTAVGQDLARRLVARGAMLDLAHASDQTADDLLAVAEAANAPVIDSHTGARALVHIDRNLDDAHIVRVARTGGVVALSLHSGHISPRPGEAATLDDVVAHAIHLRRIAGIDHMAIGSDLEGDILLPTGVEGAAVWPELARRLASNGFSEAELRKLFRENAERVFSWAQAHGCGSGSLAN